MGRMQKEVAVTCCKILYRYLPGGTEENKEKLQRNRSPSQDLNPGLPKYGVIVPIIRSQRLEVVRE